MNLFLDSSALAKRYVREPGSELVERRIQEADAVAVAVLCYPEIVSALQRRRREGKLTVPIAEAAQTALEHHLGDMSVVQLTSDVLERAVQLLKEHPLRAADALHVACAILWRADLFVSSDERQCAAAKASGLQVLQA